MFLSKRSSGIYYLWFTDDTGRKQKVSTGSRRKSDALKFLQRFRQEEHEKLVKLRQTSLSQFIEDFLRHSAVVHRPKTVESYRTALKSLLKAVGNLPLQHITTREVQLYVQGKRGTISDVTLRSYYTHMASCFETARKWGCIASNPFRSFPRPKAPEIQPAFLSAAEFEKLLAAISDPDFRRLVLFAVSTGLRLGEILSLRWGEIDLVRRVIFVRSHGEFRTKSRRNRTVPMNDVLWEMLSTMQEGGSADSVFRLVGKPLRGEVVSKKFKDYIRLAGLDERLHFHSLRHTFASWLVQSGATLYEVQKLLGHSSAKVTEIYSHLQPEQMHATVNRIVISMN
jgi:integrase